MKDITVSVVTSTSDVAACSTSNCDSTSQSEPPKKPKKPCRYLKNSPRKKNDNKTDRVGDLSNGVNVDYNCTELSKQFSIGPVLRDVRCRFVREKVGRKRIKIYSFIRSFVPVVFGLDCGSSGVLEMVRKFSNLRVNAENNVRKIANDKKVRKPVEKIETETSKIPVKKAQKKPKTQKKAKGMMNKKQKPFREYIGKESLDNGLKNGDYVKGFLRINPNSKEGYVNNSDKSLQDYVISSMEDRNRALDGDEVILKLKPEADWKDGQITAIVVAIHQMIHSRLAVGHLKLMPDKNKTYAAFTPRDGRIPRLRISSISWPPNFYNNSAQYENVLFLAKITEWTDVRFAFGTIIENIGISGDLKAESIAILREYELDTTPYGHEVRPFLSFPEVTVEEMGVREDWRGECVFTIDPASARDLDDALSCRELANGNLEIGVHISDVAFVLADATSLDEIVRQKATTIYLVDSTYHMLPLEMCLHCSLLPGQDKRAFSVIWEMTDDGKVLNTRFSRTLVRSCVKLAYEHAQRMIENEIPAKGSITDDMPEIFGPYTAESISKIVNQLNRIALVLRRKRFESGALRLDQPKLAFKLDPKSGEPEQWSVYEIKDAHRMIEEFMLLANMSVAEKLLEDFPDLAFLRCHEPPKHTMLEEVQRTLQNAGITIDISSAGALQSSLHEHDSEEFLAHCKFAVLSHMLTKPMKRANYFCAGSVENEQGYAHYALNVPLYTHFTSPIRRYADVVVHRLLAASLGYTERPAWTVDYVQGVAQNCNKQKYNAKRAGDASLDLYLAHYVERHQPFIQSAVVVNVREKYFEVLVLASGSVLKIFTNDFDESVKVNVVSVDDVPTTSESKPEKQAIDHKQKSWRMEIKFPAEKNCIPECTVPIERFAVLKVALERKEKTNKLTGKVVRPLPSISFGCSDQKSFDCSTTTDDDFSD